VRRWCRLVREVLDVPVDPTDLRLAVPPPPEGAGAVLVHPGAAYPARRWPADRFAAVARAVVAAGHRVEVTGGPGEEALAQAVADAAGSPGASALGGRTSLGDLAARVAHARLVVCGDTGVAHLATAFGTPSVLLFGPTSPARWGPPPGGPHTVIFHGDGQGDPWGGEVAPALLRVTVPEVVAEVQHHLGRPLTGAARRTTPGSA
jgi:ADP-heptose:LPS heptosyltransferase